MSDRACRDCSECCTAMAIPDVESEMFDSCRHLCSRGCSIYEQRPESCRGFLCLWMQGFGKVADRPDRTGVTLDYQQLGELHVVKAYVTRYTERGRKLLMELAQKTVVYTIHRDGRRSVNGPNALVQEFILLAHQGGASREFLGKLR